MKTFCALKNIVGDFKLQNSFGILAWDRRGVRSPLHLTVTPTRHISTCPAILDEDFDMNAGFRFAVLPSIIMEIMTGIAQ